MQRQCSDEEHPGVSVKHQWVLPDEQARQTRSSRSFSCGVSCALLLAHVSQQLAALLRHLHCLGRSSWCRAHRSVELPSRAVGFAFTSERVACASPRDTALASGEGVDRRSTTASSSNPCISSSIRPFRAAAMRARIANIRALHKALQYQRVVSTDSQLKIGL